MAGKGSAGETGMSEHTSCTKGGGGGGEGGGEGGAVPFSFL